MNMNLLARWIASLVMMSWLSACNLNVQQKNIPLAWIDAPLDGTVLPLAPYEIVAHASDPAGISQIEISVNGAVIGNVAGSAALFTARQTWSPSAPGEYRIQARGMNSGGVWSEHTEVRVIVQGDVPLTPEATEVVPSATQAVPTLVLIKNANCRLGPSQVFEAVNSAFAGDSLPIQGKNEDETWWLVRLPTGEQCWVSGITGSTSGNVGLVPVAEAPPLQGCFVYDPNLQPVCTFPCPENPDPGGECTP